MALISSLTVVLSTNSAQFGAGLKSAQSSLASFSKGLASTGLTTAKLGFVGLGSAAVEAGTLVRAGFVASMTAARAASALATRAISLGAATLRAPFVAALHAGTASLGVFRTAIHGVSVAMGTMLKTVAPLAALFGLGAMIREGATFEKRMDSVLALTGANTTEFASLSKQARKLGKDTVFSATQAAEAMEKLSLAGFKTDQIMAAMPGTLSLAAAGELEIADAADIAAKILSNMQLETSQMGNVADVLAKAMSTANTDLLQLGEAMKFAGPIAHTAGKGLNETVAAIQALSNAGLQGEMAGTALRGILTKMAGPTDEAKAAMKKLRIEFLDAHKNLKPMPQIVDEMNLAMAGMGKGEKLEFLSQVFEQRSATGFAVLLQAGGDKLRDFETQLANAAGTAKTMEQIKLDNIAGGWELFTSAISELAIKITLGMADGLRSILDFGAKAVDFIGTVWPAIASVTSAGLSAISAVISAGWSAIWSFTTSIFGGLKDLTGGGMESIAETVIIALTIVEHYFTHWQDVAKVVGLNVAYFVVRLGNQMAYVFTEVIPTTLTWFLDNWKDIFFTLFDFTATIFINIGKNIRSAFAAIWEFIKTGGQGSFEVVWTPLTDGFKSAIRELPQIAEREIGGLEKSLAADSLRLSSSLATGANDLVAERLHVFRKELLSSELFGGGLAPAAAAAVADDAVGGRSLTAASSDNRPKALERGTAEAFSASLNSSSALARTAKAAEETAKHAGAQRKTLDKIER